MTNPMPPLPARECGPHTGHVATWTPQQLHDYAKAYAAPFIARVAELQADAERQLEIGRAVERACRELPHESDGIELRLERDAGTVYYLKNGCWIHIEGGDSFGDQINEAIDAAIAAKD